MKVWGQKDGEQLKRADGEQLKAEKGRGRGETEVKQRSGESEGPSEKSTWAQNGVLQPTFSALCMAGNSVIPTAR